MLGEEGRKGGMAEVREAGTEGSRKRTSLFYWTHAASFEWAERSLFQFVPDSRLFFVSSFFLGPGGPGGAN